MSVTILTQKLEKSFWTTAILLMSESAIVRSVIYKSYKFFQFIGDINETKALILFSVVFFIAGFGLGLLSGLI